MICRAEPAYHLHSVSEPLDVRLSLNGQPQPSCKGQVVSL
jgi:hypothetical protein